MAAVRTVAQLRQARAVLAQKLADVEVALALLDADPQLEEFLAKLEKAEAAVRDTSGRGNPNNPNQ